MTRKNRTAGVRRVPPSPLPDFAQGLRALRTAAGDPSYQEMERTAGYPAAILSAAAEGERLPSLAVTLAYVDACGGDRAEWAGTWYEANAKLEETKDDSKDDEAHGTVEFPRVKRAYRPPAAAPRRNSVKVWVIVGVLTQIGVFAATQIRQSQAPTSASAVQAAAAQPQAQPTQRQTPAGTRAGAAPQKPAFTAVAGPGCPRDASRNVRINGVPGKDGWKDASVAGWTGAGCGDSFLFSELTYDPQAVKHPQNSFQWKFTTGLRGQHQCFVAVYVPKSGLAGQRVWYTVKDGFDEFARTVGEFTLDQGMRVGTWVPAPVPITITSGLVMVEITDTGKGNTTGDQSMAAGPLRLTCL